MAQLKYGHLDSYGIISKTITYNFFHRQILNFQQYISDLLTNNVDLPFFSLIRNKNNNKTGGEKLM